MAKFVVAELQNMVLGLSQGVYAEGELGRKPFCLCYTMTDAIAIADALNAFKPVPLPAVQSQKAKRLKPTVGRKVRKKA